MVYFDGETILVTMRHSTMLTMAQHGIVIGISSICNSMMVDHVYFNVYNIIPLGS